MNMRCSRSYPWRVSVVSKVHDELTPSRFERLRQVARGSGLESEIALAVAVSYIALAYLDGGTEPQFRAGAAIALWVAVILGLALGLWPRAPIPRPALIAGMCLGGLAALAGLSMTWANDNEQAFIEVIRVLAYLGLFVAVVLASSRGGARPWLLGLALGLAAVAIVALLSRLQPGLFPAAQAMIEELPPARVRLSFPTAYWNGLGTCMAFAIVLFTWLAVDGKACAGRAAATALVPPAALVLFLTSSRGAVVALALGLGVLLVIGRPRWALAGSALVGLAGAGLVLALCGVLAPEVLDGELVTAEGMRQGDLLMVVTALVVAATGLARYVAEQLPAQLRMPRVGARTATVAAVLIVAAALALGTAAGAIDSATAWVGDRVEGACELPEGPGGVTTHLASSSGSGRCQYWEVGLDAFAQAPLGGLGGGGFAGWWAEHHTFTRPVSFTHSLFITALADLGLLGFALVAGFLAVAFAAGLRARSGPGPRSTPAVASALLVAGIFSATIDWMWEFPAVFAIVVVVAALLTGPALAPAPGRQRSRFGFGVAALIAAWVTVVLALLSFFGQAKIVDSEEALNRNDLVKAAATADTATTLQPWAAEPYLLKAAALEAQGELGSAGDGRGGRHRPSAVRLPDLGRRCTHRGKVGRSVGSARVARAGRTR